ncbi:divalent metal cation transporter, partial [bacterium M00.F.Ca.ET.194.01.1.1]
WPVGLERQPKEAMAFYTTLAAAAMLGMAIIFMSIDPIRALYWSAVTNGICAVPVMVVMMQMTGRSEVMGEFPVQGWLRALGWLATSTMVLSVVGLVLQWI